MVRINYQLLYGEQRICKTLQIPLGFAWKTKSAFQFQFITLRFMTYFLISI